MKIINLDEFLKMPKGTLFMKYEPTLFYKLCVKDDSVHTDFFYMSITDDVDANSSDEAQDKMFDAEENKSSIRLDFNALYRDGMFNKKQLFAIYEKDDVEGLIEKLIECKNIAYK